MFDKFLLLKISMEEYVIRIGLPEMHPFECFFNTLSKKLTWLPI